MVKNTQATGAGWNFDNSYARLPELFYTKLQTNPVTSPKLMILNRPLAEALGLNPQMLETDEGVAVFAGNDVPEGAEPLAQAYAGHQFGYFNRLGDGRALLIGEQITPSGERFDIQLKGSGRTPYSRGGDGRAALGPMLREYIISEAMHGLGIPTTRSLAVVKTGEHILRETELPGAILTRVAASHIRVGTFQYAANWGKDGEIRELADYVLKRHFPSIDGSADRYLQLFREVVRRQASLIAKWQLVGFIHGVMNTDNMAISGETIDYGPCAFMDTYDSGTVFSSIDTEGRYAFGNQPQIAGWNLARFAETLLPLFHENNEEAVIIAQDAISEYPELFRRHWLDGMRAKLGLFDREELDGELIESLLAIMHVHQADYTNTFLDMTFNRKDCSNLHGSSEFAEWQERWQARLQRQQEPWEASQELMKRSNPAVIPRNHRVEEALEAAENEADYSVMEELLHAIRNPYAHSEEQAEYAKAPPSSKIPYQTFCGT
ncbi:YdiU family protein [Paenibacillus sp. GCM10012307]|uniref:Protein nucleotidyltransferase YdiU n=1 Tax=Paenibacillus roseus TaxID=2798579 RepID=A0A934IXT4_9BACL|nr:YdiU family protein [Paenibacillus roseus]MBJ6361232.1 YdiU family protein [Paenibacillus roseus]